MTHCAQEALPQTHDALCTGGSATEAQHTVHRRFNHRRTIHCTQDVQPQTYDTLYTGGSTTEVEFTIHEEKNSSVDRRDCATEALQEVHDTVGAAAAAVVDGGHNWWMNFQLARSLNPRERGGAGPHKAPLMVLYDGLWCSA